MTHVFISFKVEGGVKEYAKEAKVHFDECNVLISSDNEPINIALSNPIDVGESVSIPSEKKIELKLKKQVNANWISLEPNKGNTMMATQVPVQVQPGQKANAYASKKNWDKIGNDIQKDLDNEKPEGDAALNGLFKQIYERADEDTRRAMMKSY